MALLLAVAAIMAAAMLLASTLTRLPVHQAAPGGRASVATSQPAQRVIVRVAVPASPAQAMPVTAPAPTSAPARGPGQIATVAPPSADQVDTPSRIASNGGGSGSICSAQKNCR